MSHNQGPAKCDMLLPNEAKGSALWSFKLLLFSFLPASVLTADVLPLASYLQFFCFVSVFKQRIQFTILWQLRGAYQGVWKHQTNWNRRSWVHRLNLFGQNTSLTSPCNSKYYCSQMTNHPTSWFCKVHLEYLNPWIPNSQVLMIYSVKFSPNFHFYFYLVIATALNPLCIACL